MPACSGHWYNSYPIGGPLLEAPLVIAEVEILRVAHPLLSHFHSSQPVIDGFLHADYDVAHALIEEEAASFLLAVSAVMMYFIALRFLPVARSVWLALLFALATSAYSVAGRALWQHTPSMLLLTIIIYMLLRAEEKPALAAWAGFPVALAYTVRPTDSLFVLIFTVYVAVRHRAYLLRYLLAAAPVAVAFIAYNESVYHFHSFAVLSNSLGWLSAGQLGAVRRGAGRQFDQPVARIIHLHSGFPIRDLEHASPKMVRADRSMAGRAGAFALDRDFRLRRQLVGRPMLWPALLHGSDAGLRAVSDSLFPELDRPFARPANRVRGACADWLRNASARRMVECGVSMERHAKRHRPPSGTQLGLVRGILKATNAPNSLRKDLFFRA